MVESPRVKMARMKCMTMGIDSDLIADVIVTDFIAEAACVVPEVTDIYPPK